MSPKVLRSIFYVFFFLGIVSVVVGILAKLIPFEVFSLKPLSYLRFTGICVLYSIAAALSVKAFPKE